MIHPAFLRRGRRFHAMSHEAGPLRNRSSRPAGSRPTAVDRQCRRGVAVTSRIQEQVFCTGYGMQETIA